MHSVLQKNCFRRNQINKSAFPENEFKYETAQTDFSLTQSQHCFVSRHSNTGDSTDVTVFLSGGIVYSEAPFMSQINIAT